MFGQVFLFELKQRLKSPVIWVLAALLAIKTISDMMGGEWQGLAGGGVPRNAPYAIYFVCVYATFWTVVFGAGLMTAPLLRDAQTRMAPLVNSSRVSSGGYFWGKYFASLVGLAVVMFGVVAGIACVPVVESAFHLVPSVQLMPTPWLHVLSAWLIWILPGCIIYGSIHFALASLTGRTLPSYGLAVLSMAVFTMFFVAFSGVTGTRLFWLEVLDPMGHHTATAQLTLWTVAERSQRFMEGTPALLLNRSLYLGGALAFLLFARWRFSIPALVAKAKAPTGRSKTMRSEQNDAFHAASLSTNPKISDVQDGLRALRVTCYLALRELKITWSGTAFRVIIGAIVLLGFLGARFGSADYYTQPEQHILPVAQYLLELVGKQMFLMLVMAGVYFGSEMLARDRTARMAILVDSAPVSTNALAGARWLGVTMLALTLAPLAAGTTFLFQLLNGYWELFPAHFLRSFLQMAPQVIVYCWLAMAIYSFTRSKIASQSISILLLFFFAILHSIDAIEQHFFVLGLPVDLVFSDFRVMAASNARHLSFDTWYFGVAGLLAVIAGWLWPRGTETQLAKRLLTARRNFTWPSVVLASLALVALAFGGTTAWREIHAHHDFRNVKQQREDAASYERQYAGTTSWPHPLVIGVNIDVTVDPDHKQMLYSGTWTLTNTDNRPMDRLYMEFPEDAERAQLSAPGKEVKLQSWDELHHVGIWHLSPALRAGQSMSLHVTSGVRFHGFEEKPFEGTIGDDTAWFKSSYLPRFHYDPTREIDSPTYRTQYGLGSRSGRSVLPDRLASNDDAGWVDIDLSISLPPEWTVVANGARMEQNDDASTGTVRFTAKHVPLAVQFVAGKLVTHEVMLSSVDGRQIPLTLVSLEKHQENVSRMIGILQEEFGEFERRFGPCPMRAISLGEIPQYQEDTEPPSLTSVQTVGGVIAMPERLGWLHNYRSAPARDWLTFVLGQELARSWWGDGIGAQEGPGSALLNEGLPTAMGLLMIEKVHGSKIADDYASILQDRLRRRMARESDTHSTVLTTNFEDYAGTQAALTLMEERRKMGSEEFDHRLRRIWQAYSGRQPLSAEEFAQSMKLTSTSMGLAQRP